MGRPLVNELLNALLDAFEYLVKNIGGGDGPSKRQNSTCALHIPKSGNFQI